VSLRSEGRKALRHREALDLATVGFRVANAPTLGNGAPHHFRRRRHLDVPDAGVYEEVRSGTLQAIRIIPRMTWTLSLVQRKAARPSQAVTAVKTIIKQQTRALLENGLFNGRLMV
jgi:hypothetical protein